MEISRIWYKRALIVGGAALTSVLILLISFYWALVTIGPVSGEEGAYNAGLGFVAVIAAIFVIGLSKYIAFLQKVAEKEIVVVEKASFKYTKDQFKDKLMRNSIWFVIIFIVSTVVYLTRSQTESGLIVMMLFMVGFVPMFLAPMQLSYASNDKIAKNFVMVLVVYIILKTIVIFNIIAPTQLFQDIFRLNLSFALGALIYGRTWYLMRKNKLNLS